jgi:acyl transferase domain-containing protein
MNADGSAGSAVKSALLALRTTQARLERLEAARSEPIAIVGIGCRLPGSVDGPDAFWRLLIEGRDGIVAVPPDRWDRDAYFDPDPDAPGRMYVRSGGFLDAIDGFDAGFFGIAPREAASLDPQHKLVLEVAWEALEHAGIPPTALRQTETGVFLGICTFDHALQLGRHEERIDSYFGSGNSLNVAAGRLAYLLGLTGPCMAVDTACSSALVAVHLACQSLRLGECTTALAAGVNVILSPAFSINFCKARMLAADGRCKTFDAAADGYGRGEGCGVVVLRTLSAAQAAGDRILALIRSSAVNQDGPSGGLSIPSGPAQQAVIRRALAAARVPPETIDYLEAHGTGTPLGDPIELEAAAAVLGEGRARGEKLLVGSVKTNIGHLEAAAGIAGLIKAALCLERAALPPHRNLAVRNPHIPWDELPIEVPTAPIAWPEHAHPRRAAVSSFGYSGTNAHAVLEQAPIAATAPGLVPGPQVLALSARTEAALRELREKYLAMLRTAPATAWADIAWTSTAGRTHFPHRCAVVADSCATAAEGLATAEIVPPLGVAARQTLEVGLIFAADPSAQVVPEECDPTVRSWLDTARALGAAAEAMPLVAGVATQHVLGQRLATWLRTKLAFGGDGWGAYAAGSCAGNPKPAEVIEALLRDWRLPEPRTHAAASLTCSILAGPGDRPVNLEPNRRWVRLDAATSMPALLASLYRCGVEIDWRSVHAGNGHRVATLPTYPFQRQRAHLAATPLASTGSETLAGRLRPLPELAQQPGSNFWNLALSGRDPSYLADHRVQGAVVLPGASFVELALAAAEQALGAGRYALHDLAFHRLLVLPPDRETTLQISLARDADGALFRVHGRGPDDTGWTLHASARVRRAVCGPGRA